ncbi:phage tail family protein [Bacillus cereus group sp. TH204-1LC]|uniref:phage tail family protein n=1 Tax=Bacillus cereus group sp. TH204-1LC TaxID=3018054 RepID=UPI0022E71587|nr:phage tail family protein [Bacillus cereus group sp. TH204-1LC]MDA1620148.1 phage tail family protein [Bacillus cereus group sp. TH204-1LC]
MHLIIERLNGRQYKLSKETGYIVLKFRPESIKVNRQRESMMGRPPIVTDKEIEGRPIHTEILFTSYDFFDHVLKRNEFFQILDSREDFYVISSEEPGKRWLVSAESFTPEPVSITLGRCEIVLYSESPYAESIGTTMDPMTFDSNLWQIGQGLIAEDTKYHHTTTSFRIYNAGDVLIDPRYMPLKIKYKGRSNNLSIKNVTTGDLWSYTGTTTTPNSIIALDGVKAYRSVIGSIFKDTNWGLITLKPGWNDFVLTGTTDAFEVEFDFRFYYL